MDRRSEDENVFLEIQPAVTSPLKQEMWQEITEKIKVRNLAVKQNVDESHEKKIDRQIAR